MNFKKINIFAITIFFLFFYYNNNLFAYNIKMNSYLDNKSNIKEILYQIEKKYNHAGFEADFYQKTILKDIKSTEIANGKISILRPYNMRWEYKEPYSQIIIWNKKNICFFNSIDNQAIVTDRDFFLKKGINISYLSDISKIKKNFSISLQNESEDIYQLKLIPLEYSKPLLNIYLDILKKNYTIVKIKTISPYGDETIIEFKNINLKSIPDQKIFELDFPETTEILELNN